MTQVKSNNWIANGNKVEIKNILGTTLSTWECKTPSKFIDKSEANARLIAAAPELLEALQELTQSFGLTKTVIVSKIQQAAFDKSITAIQKATL